jgi:hypothetical protein
MYTTEMLDSEGKPLSGPKVLTPSEAARQRAAGRALKSVMSVSQSVPATSQLAPVSSQSALKPLPTPLLDSEEEYPPQKSEPPLPISPYCPEGEDWSWMNPNQLKLAEAAARAHVEGRTSLPPRSPSSPSLGTPPKKSADPTIQAPAKGVPLVIKKAAAPLQAPAEQPIKGKAPTRRKGQESPETKVSPPMETRARKKASGAGGLRGVAGSGSNGDTCVATGNPSSKPGW